MENDKFRSNQYVKRDAGGNRSYNGIFYRSCDNTWVINELLGRKIAELEKGANDENITTEN